MKATRHEPVRRTSRLILIAACRWAILPVVLLLSFLLVPLLAVRADDSQAAPAAKVELPPPTEITQDTVLDPEKTYGPLVIKASKITIDGRGAKIVGATAGAPKAFRGNGIYADGVSQVTLKNVRVQGFDTGLRIVNGEQWLIEGCDFSGNFHDPDFGWGEQGRRGGIVLERLRKSTLKKNKANQVWDGCALVNSDDNTLTENDFSHTSNTCLKLWTSSRNTISKNVLSHGIRISPGEVHARDSTSVLIESGSNDNRFLDNNCTYGGDGIFVRVLNGWVSTGNHFEGNDCSYANNNGFECWAPRNVFVKNKANHCSYGFWMGGSDGTRLIGNQASFSGEVKGHHNSPHLPENGHAGIVFMFGPGSHCVARQNICQHNNGAGLAIIGDIDSKGEKWKAFHWVIAQNTFTENRWGIYLRYADWITLSQNVTSPNTQQEIRDDGGVSRLAHLQGQFGVSVDRKAQSPTAVLEGPASGIVGQPVVFDARGSLKPGEKPVQFAWDLGDGTVAESQGVRHIFRKPGFFRVGLTVNDGTLADLAYRDFYAVEPLPELATEGQAADWGFVVEPNLEVTFRDARDVKIAGASSVHAVIDPYHGQRATLIYPRSKSANWLLTGKTHLVFWLKSINPNLGWQDANPVVTLQGPDAKSLRLTPKKDFLSHPTFNEGREGWKYFEIPLAGDDQWQREGSDLGILNSLTIGVDSWDAQPLQLWIDGLALK